MTSVWIRTNSDQLEATSHLANPLAWPYSVIYTTISEYTEQDVHPYVPNYRIKERQTAHTVVTMTVTPSVYVLP